jgi:hypothetical protein
VVRPGREAILQEIRRCAAENGGVPLGRGRFEADTGIREGDWLGLYWTRWGDAVTEAGFEPNVLQSRVHDDDGMLRHLAMLTRQLGHYPTIAEMKMHRNNDPAFPSAESLRMRIGGRNQQIARVVAWTTTAPDFADVNAICEPLVAAEGPPTTDAVAAKAKATGFVYLVRSGKHHKIGRANDLGRRSYEIALQLPERLKLVHAFETDDPPGIERYWHERFAEKRVNGEWFLLSAADVAAFRARRRFM